MQNYVQPGQHVTLTAPAALASGEPFLVGAIFAVATSAAASGTEVEGARLGVFDLPKVTGAAWAQGDKLYWDNAVKKVTKTSAGNTFVGAALTAAGAADTIGRVLLHGGPAS